MIRIIVTIGLLIAAVLHSWRRLLKIEQLHEWGGSKGVVTLIPDENGSENALMVMWRGVTRLCCVPGRVPLAPGASHRCARGSPHGNTSDTRCSLIPCFGGAGGISDGLREPKGFHEAGASDAAAATATEHPGYDAAHQNVRQRLVHRRARQQGTHHQSP